MKVIRTTFFIGSPRNVQEAMNLWLLKEDAIIVDLKLHVVAERRTEALESLGRYIVLVMILYSKKEVVE